MTQDITSYVPFKHHDYSYIKGVIEIAREQDVNTVDGLLASTLIYNNAIDYISSHLVSNLQTICSIVTKCELVGIVYCKAASNRNQPLGLIISELNGYEFPDKQEFIANLDCYKKLRNRVTHDLMRLTKDEVDKVDRDFEELRSLAETLLNQYDTICQGITLSWHNYVKGLANRNRADLPDDVTAKVEDKPNHPPTKSSNR